MENTASTSKTETGGKTCQYCKRFFDDSKILKHATFSKCKKQYTDKELDNLRNLADQRKKRKDSERRHKIRENKLEQNNLVLKEICKSCNRNFSENSILNHINQSKSCLKQYNEEFESDMGWLRHLSDERKKYFEAENWAENKASISAKRAGKYSPTQRKEKYEKKKEIRDQLTETCKSCKKNFWDTSFLRHIGQKQSCKEEYTNEQLEFMRGWAKERKRLNEIDYREQNKEALAVRRSQRNKEKKEKKREEMIAEHIRVSKITFRNNKLTYERDARIENKIRYDGSKEIFYPVFQTFQKYKLSKKDSQAIVMFQKSFKDMFDKFESEIDKVAAVTKDMEYEYEPDLVYTSESRAKNPEKYKNRKGSFRKLADLWSTLTRSNYQIRDEWHDHRLNIDLTLKEIATKLKKPYEWEDSCFCDKCLSVKNIDAKKEEKLRRKMMDRIFASGKCPKLS